MKKDKLVDVPMLINHEWRMQRLIEIVNGSKAMSVEKINIPTFDLWVIVERLVFFEKQFHKQLKKKRKK